MRIEIRVRHFERSNAIMDIRGSMAHPAISQIMNFENYRRGEPLTFDGLTYWMISKPYAFRRLYEDDSAVAIELIRVHSFSKKETPISLFADAGEVFIESD